MNIGDQITVTPKVGATVINPQTNGVFIGATSVTLDVQLMGLIDDGDLLVAGAANPPTLPEDRVETLVKETIEAEYGQQIAARISQIDVDDQLRDDRVTAKEVEMDGFISTAGLALKQSSGGALVCLKTVGGQDTWFYRIGKCSWLDLRADGALGSATDIHEAFLHNGVEKDSVWFAAFDMSYKNGEAVSQPNVQPRHSRTQAEEIAECAATQIAGIPAGAHRDASNWDYSLVYYWMMANGYQPIGNTSYGNSHEKPWVTGVGGSRINTGSMGDLANHTGTSQGIADIVGNVWQRYCGMELRDGEYFIAADNGDATNPANYISLNHYCTSSNANGNGTPSIITDASAIVRNGAVGDNSHGSYDARGGSTGFATLSGSASVLMKRACLAPFGDGTDGKGAFYARTFGTRPAIRGGGWYDGSYAGIAMLNLHYAASRRSSIVGFRSAFVL